MKDADVKLKQMEQVAGVLREELTTQTKRVDDCVRDLNELKDVALGQTSNLNARSIEIEQKIESLNDRSIVIKKKMQDYSTQHSDLITNLGEFGKKQTADISALRANIEMWAVGFQGKIESHLSGVGGSAAGIGGAGSTEREKRGLQVDRKEVAVWKFGKVV